jgi:hypothetical protein
VGKDAKGDLVEMPPPPPPKPEPPAWMNVELKPHTAHITDNNKTDGSRHSNHVFVYGFPGQYAGANTELHHQIILWRSMGLTVHLIPSGNGYRQEPLYPEMIERGVLVLEANQFDAIIPGAPVFGYCNDQFLLRIDEILKYSHNTVFVNCMTWLFELEQRRHREGKISMFLYQNSEVMKKNASLLRKINPDPTIQFHTVKPYFDTDGFPFIQSDEREQSTYVIGRISRHDPDKFSAETLMIWNAVQSSSPKRGIMLGFGSDSEKKIGKVPEWVQTYRNQTELSQQDFYRQVDVIIQPMDTIENWPRIGLEAMASGCVLIVDHRGGWQQMIEHGVTGWLCRSGEEFTRYASRMAARPDLRKQISMAARNRLEQLAGQEAASASWRAVFKRLGVRTPSLDELKVVSRA